MTLEAGRAGGDDGRFSAAACWTDETSEALPSLSKALVRALSFIGTGISSSELSLSVEYCCCESDLDSFAGLDSLRLS
jgi:hypothetical protein